MSVPTLAPNNQLNIQGVHASNISSTPILSSYPTTNTGSSLGHYAFNNSLTNTTTLLNCSSTLAGGHILAHSSSTQAPINVLSVNRDGLTIDTQLKNTTSNAILNMVSNDLTFTNDLSVSFLNNEAFKFKYNGATNVQINNSPENPNVIFTSATTNSQLTASDLTFGGVSLPSKVSQNTTDISNNTTNITNNTTAINALNLKIPQQIVSQIVLSSPAIYADSSIAPQPSQFLATYGYNGWGYQKKSPQTSNAKINWYFPSPVLNGTVATLKGLYYQCFNNCLGTGDLPYFTVYTKPTGVNDYKSWYHSSNTYVPNSNSPANQSCQMFMNIKGLDYIPNSVNVQNQISMIQSTVSNPKGDYQDTDVILFIVCGTNSASALNAVDVVVNKIGFITNNFTTEFLLL